MRIIFTTLALVALTACGAPVPDDRSGVGFGDFDEYEAAQRQRDARLARAAVPANDALSNEALKAPEPVAVAQVQPQAQPRVQTPENSDLASETQAALDGTKTASGDAVVPVPSGTPAFEPQKKPGISDENDFEAVGSRRTIENDADLIARNKEQYKVIAATALPKRTGGTGPNIVEYALRSTHPLGTRVYRRISINKGGKFRRNCAKFSSPDLAQSDFLAKGGPQRDRMGLDPDGDGFACAWDPAPFRKAVGG